MKKLLIVMMGFAIVGVIVLMSASTSYAQSNAQAGCSVVAKTAEEVCVRPNNHIPCLQDLSGRTADFFCYKNNVQEGTFDEIGLCRVWLQETPCGPDCTEEVPVDCCCFTPSGRAAP